MITLPKRMWAGVVDGHIYVVPQTGDDYVPFGIALFTTEAKAREKFENVQQVDPAKLLAAALKERV